MKNLLTACCIVLGVIFVYGFVAGKPKDRMRVSVLDQKNVVVVVITIPDVDASYRWLQVYGCSAEITENGAFCTERWSTASGREPHGLTQHLIPFRQVPGGPLQFTAFALDARSEVLADARLTILRGW